jgi:hypothetical protein
MCAGQYADEKRNAGSQSHMPRGVGIQIPADEKGEAAEHMEEDAPAP